MDRVGVARGVYVRAFGPRIPSKGRMVKIREGPVVYSTHPSMRQAVLGRDLVVKVHSADRGWVGTGVNFSGSEVVVRQAQVHWSGTGGYWRWTDANNIVDGAE